ncbi:hypothetical protein [Paracoccus sp. SSJ]|uniref:hypothetical protein n=1 Tax=Paracoccus sp. SSJ TaxID=3050636 RepID=UPI00254CF79A|nr:hypothetical protein [Paracoccus sp. SSJ]MDK8874688.1 hypothetical protein [Paracoccus sp. SSJ]
MTHYRSEIRALARAALTAHPRFAAFTAPKVWPGTVDADSLPVIGVLTPQDSSRMETMTSTERKPLMQVAVRRKGGDDVEDILDDDSELIEAIVLGAIRAQNRFCFLRETSVVSNTDGIQNVGTLVMTFEITTVRPEATLPAGP